jgi:hypothetical protein
VFWKAVSISKYFQGQYSVSMLSNIFLWRVERHFSIGNGGVLLVVGAYCQFGCFGVVVRLVSDVFVVCRGRDATRGPAWL